MIFEFKDEVESVIVLDNIVEFCRVDEEIRIFIKNRDDELTYTYDSEYDAKTDYKRLKEAFKKFHEPKIELDSFLKQDRKYGTFTSTETTETSEPEEKKYL